MTRSDKPRLDKIKELLNAGLKIHLSENTLGRIEALSDEEIDELVRICRKLCDPKSRRFLVYSEWSTEQPPGTSF